LESHKWVYEEGVCNVTFKLRNDGNRVVDLNVRIVAHKQKSIGKGAVVDDIIGEKVVSVRIGQHEEKELSETLALFQNIRPDRVVVSHHKAK